MRVTIWQQFSSNHSSFFTVVGEFQSPEAAQQATNELRRIIQSVVDWYAAHPEHEEKWIHDYWPPTPAEYEIAAQYSVRLDDEYGMDWIGAETDPQSVVTTMDCLVFLAHPIDTWNGGHPFDWIIEKLGGRGFIDGWHDVGPYWEEQSTHILINFVCNAPNPVAAQNIAQELSDYMQIRFNFNLGTLSLRREDITISGRQLRFIKRDFYKIASDLSNLIAYLKSRGCTDIEYQVSYVDRDSNEAESL